ncbi:hypothetical protein SERLA73DRAFT_152587 [Serpula lacrymans var. lacrymans S7.3]|uniref:DUF1764-domain-containing protein n=2 Tax=Serpula lacrymans var. lacrymans TaxID=341189 RepID=F8PXZ4_SERL3|nr:uncharacterized protein SERLADRAFT_408337 [Serpula lacrymans var. lacrymans S7.9]EGN98757.1 hypothetical protein SERLA73DRAFT_152587 [Serpula lacrymans var. lacrymans S7.3]EGO24352.1 hypothetical protein SERLADRAFT_408337 [Serpula lacrymans var. lacrymans S7.9]
MPASEIDAIFSSANKGKFVVSVTSSSTTLPEKKKKKKSKKAKSADLRDPKDEVKLADEPKQGTKRPPPETVFDPSIQEPKAKRTKSSGKDALKVKSTKTSKKDKDKEDEDRFKDSRGNGPRRKTEEGFGIYKEDELGISHEGGDTPLCPFDCECCF